LPKTVISEEAISDAAPVLSIAIPSVNTPASKKITLHSIALYACSRLIMSNKI